MGLGRDLGVPNDPGLTVDQRVAVVARRQKGVASAQQLRACGLGRGAVKHRSRSGLLHHIHPEVYAVGHREVSRLGEFWAAVLSYGRRTVISHRSAGELDGILNRYSGPIEVTVNRRGLTRRRGTLPHVAHLDDRDVRRVKGIATTTREQTLLDLVLVLEPETMTKAFQNARRKGLTIARLDRFLARKRGAPGSARLGKLVDRHRHQKGVTRGGFEDDFYAWLDAWLPEHVARPHINQLIDDGIEADLWFPDHKLAIELDYWGHHGADRLQNTKDRRRDRKVTIAKLRVVRITSDEFNDDPEGIKADLIALLGL